MKQNLSTYIDHTLLSPLATTDQIIKLCQEALEWQFAAVCVPPVFVDVAKQTLHNSSVKVCTVIGFPFGYNLSTIKLQEAEEALLQGADELDMVLPLYGVKSNNWNLVQEEMVQMKKLTANKVLKVILETAYLSKEEIIRACLIAKEAEADFVKTSTGFAKSLNNQPTGATAKIVKLLRETVGPQMGVKASGGIRSLKQALEMMDAGASRLGTSSGVQIMKELKGNI